MFASELPCSILIRSLLWLSNVINFPDDYRRSNSILPGFRALRCPPSLLSLGVGVEIPLYPPLPKVEKRYRTVIGADARVSPHKYNDF